MDRPLIGISGQLEAAHWGTWIREAVLSPVGYTRAVDRAGGVPVVLPPLPARAVDSLLRGIDGLLLTGGTDVDPALYDAPRHECTDPPNPRRDTFETALVRAAINAGLPLLAIGRGLHVLNVVRGGTLIQHLPDTVGHSDHAPGPGHRNDHDVQLSAGSLVGRMLGDAARVPATHHQAVHRLGHGLLAVGWARDHVVEAVELPGHRFAVGVQWHPEESDDRRIVDAMVAAARELRQGRDDRLAADPSRRAVPAPADRSVRPTAHALG